MHNDFLSNVYDTLSLSHTASGSFDVPRVKTRIGSQAFSSVEQFARGNEECTDDPKCLQEQTEDILVRTGIPGYWPMRMFISKFDLIYLFLY